MPTGLYDDQRFCLLGSTRNDEGPPLLAVIASSTATIRSLRGKCPPSNIAASDATGACASARSVGGRREVPDGDAAQRIVER